MPLFKIGNPCRCKPAAQRKGVVARHTGTVGIGLSC